MIVIETPLGDIEITEEYFSRLIGHVVPSCFGVAGMANGNTMQEIRSLISRNKNFDDKGVIVKKSAEGIDIDLHIAVTYGVNISEIVKSIINKVRYAVEEPIGLKVTNVNVYVDEMKN